MGFAEISQQGFTTWSALRERGFLRMPQVYCVFLFMVATTLFGVLVSELNEIVAMATFATKELDENLEAYSVIKPG